jgi:hypothetical protein
MHMPNQSFKRAEIKKMSPDPSALHIPGAGGRVARRKRGRLKRINKE